ncbi:hypothetical protein JOC62_003178 [Clostridium sardiniense]|nr:hypothetical protein [Clostridium sardiniense]
MEQDKEEKKREVVKYSDIFKGDKDKKKEPREETDWELIR